MRSMVEGAPALRRRDRSLRGKPPPPAADVLQMIWKLKRDTNVAFGLQNRLHRPQRVRRRLLEG